MNMKKVLLFVLAISTAIILAACGSSKSSGDGNSSKVFKSDDEKYQVSATKDWADAEGELHPESNLQIYIPQKEKYLMALMESKEDFVDMSLESYFDIVTDMFQSNLKDVQAGDIKEVTINGNNALQYELKAVADGIKIAYLITIIETPEDYGQLIVWTIGSKWDKYKDEYVDLVNSFQEIK